MWSFLLVLAIALCTVFSVTLITSASSAGESRITNADFSDVVMTVGADETERGITWYSSYNTEGEVQYAKKTGNEFPDEFKTAVARVVAANESGSYSYKATMRSLCANTEYVYRLVVGDTVSAVYEFETKGFGDFNFVYVADPQVGSASSMAVWENTVNRIESDLNPSFIISGGDQIATPTSETEYGYFLVDGLTGIALAPSNGPAHDNSVLLMDHFNLPNLSSTYGVTLASADYSYTYGNTLFVHLNVESASCEEHIAFLEREIASNPECRWQIVVLHYSFFSGSTASTNANIVEMGEKLAGKLCEAGVDLVLSGHDHFYARSELLTGYGTVSNDVVTNNTVTNPTGTLYICGSTATGLSIDTPVNQNYAVVQNAQNRRNAINITVTDGTLSISAYFLDTEVPELFDSFTINRTDNVGGTVEKYSVTYVTNENSDINGNLSDYSTAYYAVGFMPDPPSLVLPAGSIEEGALYEYSWEYYLNGNKVDTFTAGNEYVAKIVKTTKAVSDTLIISRTANNAEGIYTWAEAWDLAAKFPTNHFTFKLNENITFNKYDQLSVVTKVNVTIDLAGYTWDSQGIQYLVNLTTGSTGSVLSVISSREGGKILAQAPIIVSSNHSSTITVNYGSEDAFPIEVKADGSSGYLVHAGGNFKRGSTLNLNITNGSYSVDAGLVFVRNAGAELSAANHYIINIDNATVTTEGNLIVFNQEYKASASSIIAATNSVIKASGAAVSALSSDLWYGGFEFTGTELDGIIFADKTANITGVSFGDGCTLKNCDANFNSDKTAFASERLSTAEGLFLSLGADGTVSVTDEEKLPDNVLLISKTANHDKSIYTWNEAWSIAMANPGVAYIFRLNENSNMGGSELLKVTQKCNVTLDLAGFAMKVSENSTYLISFEGGSTGSTFSVISSKEGGSYNGPSIACIGSGGATSISISIGSADSYPISITTFKTPADKIGSSNGALVSTLGNFKGGSTLTLSVENGSYDLEGGIIYVRNYSTNKNNKYYITIDNANITLGDFAVRFHESFRAVEASYITATNSSFTYSDGTISFLAASQWDGSLEFSACGFVGVEFDATTTASVSECVFKKGCTFESFGETFNSDRTAFASEKLSVAEGLFLSLGADGTVSVTDEEKLPDNVLLISKTANHDKSIYTWNEAWSIAMANPGVAYIFRLNENSNMGGSELLKVTQKCNVTLDLAGFAMKVSENSTYLISFEGGSTGSTFSVISSKEGGSYNGPSIACIGSGGATSISISIGSADSYPISITTFKTPADKIGSSNGALVSTLGNFKGGSTLTLSVENGSYDLEGGIIYVRNYSTNKNNKYYITIDNANITLGDFAVRFHESFRAVEASYITATNSSFTYSDGTISFLAASQWDGSLEFSACGFVGVEFDATTTASVSECVFKKGCTFESFGETFNSSANDFASDKITCEEGYYPVIGESGSVVIVKPVSSIDRYSITLGTDIALNLYATIHSAHEGAFVRFTINGKTVDVAGVYAEGIGYLFVFDGIGPHAMNDVVTAELVLGDSILATLDGISVKGYCDGMLKKTAEELNITESKLASLKSLIASLLEYGAAAQEYLGYNTDSLANKGIDKSLLLDFVNPNKTASLSTPSIEGVEITGASVWFDSTNSLRIRFTTTDVTSTTVKVGGKTYTSESFTKINDNTYVLTCDPILPANFGDDVVFELYIGESLSHGLTYGISYYVTSMQSSANEKMKNLATALYNYGVAAADFKS